MHRLAGSIVTGRYADWQRSHGVPLQATVGTPKFWRGPELVDFRIAAPWGLLDPSISDDEAERRYLARLDRRSDAVVDRLHAIADEHQGEQLVVMCFENVHAGQVCHRRWLADWLEDRHGLVVPEVGAGDQLRLFD